MLNVQMTGPGVDSIYIDGRRYTANNGVFSIPTNFTSEALDMGLVLTSSGGLGFSDLNAAAVQPLMNKIARNVENAQILVLGDSTGDEITEWPYLMTLALVTKFPTYSVYYSLWNGSAWPAPTQISTGTGAQTLTVYNGSVSGTRTPYSLGGNEAVMVAALAPDLIFTSYGHNQGTNAASWWGDYLNLTENLSMLHPQAGLVMILQNPAQANNNQQLRATVYESICRARGCGMVNAMQRFLDYGATRYPDLMKDTVHPNDAGQLSYWLPEVMQIFSYNRSGPIRGILPSTFLQRGFQLLKNNDFSTFTNGTIPANWTQLQGTATYAQDSTNFESANGYSLLLTATGGAASAIGQTLPINMVKGRWITTLCRVRIGVGAADTTGVVGLYDNLGGLLADNAGGRGAVGGAFRWVVVTKFIPATATTARFYFYADSTTGNNAANIDYASVVLGKFPMM